MIRKLSAVLLSLGLLSGSSAFALNDAGVKINWGYKGDNGPEHWAQLDSKFALCSQGKAQSPINITKKVTQAANELQINYVAAPLYIVNDGETKLEIGQEQYLIDDGHGVQVNLHPETKEIIRFAGQDYQLVQFHIHTPSETEWHGRVYPLEIHFVHQGSGGKTLVIGVLATIGNENSELQKIVSHLPKIKEQEQLVNDQTINPIRLMPNKRNYYSFAGSLTTPPCTEGLQWVVFEEPITVSPAQVATLKKAADGPNARPVQGLNNRVIYHSNY